MLLIYGSTVVGWVGLVSSLMMAITVVGFCRFGSSYQRFFDRLKRLGTLDTIKEMSRVYFAGLNGFLGKTVGIKQTDVVEKAKYFGRTFDRLLKDEEIRCLIDDDHKFHSWIVVDIRNRDVRTDDTWTREPFYRYGLY